VPFPIELNGSVVNTVQALWTKSKGEVTDSEYDDFYKYIGHDTEAPLYRLHFAADAPLSIRALFFVPQKNFELITLTRVAELLGRAAETRFWADVRRSYI